MAKRRRCKDTLPHAWPRLAGHAGRPLVGRGSNRICARTRMWTGLEGDMWKQKYRNHRPVEAPVMMPKIDRDEEQE